MKVLGWLQTIGIDIALILSGMVGSILMASRKNMVSIRDTAISILSGTLSANYLTQVAIDIFDLQGRSQYGVAFLLGYFGLKGVEKFIQRYHKIHDGEKNKL